MASIQETQCAARKIKKRLADELGLVRGSYKTSSSWSSKKYVTLNYLLLRLRDEQGNSGLFMFDYDRDKVESIVTEVCNDYGIDDNHRSVNLYDTKIQINLYSTEPVR